MITELSIVDRLLHGGADPVEVVGHDLLPRDGVTSGFQTLDGQSSGGVGLFRTRVRDGEDGGAHRNEGVGDHCGRTIAVAT